MKKFTELTVGDYVYFAWKNGVNYDKAVITKIEGEWISMYSHYIKRDVECGIEKDDRVYFPNEEQIVRYCKAQGIKHINKLIESAKNTINEIKKFKEKNWENLNVKWTEAEINKLENSLSRH